MSSLDAVLQPTTQTIYDLFNGRIQFIVPVYQRAYVWNVSQSLDATSDRRLGISGPSDRLTAPEAVTRLPHCLRRS
jgi:hypothetical protein